MKRLSVMATVAILSAAPAAIQAADSTSGRIVGYECAHQAKQCPIDKLDPHLALERDFVLVTSPGTYYLLPNLPRDVKVRYVLDQVTVNGEVNSKYNSIDVEELIGERNGKSRTVWSRKQQAGIYGGLTSQ